MKELLKNSIYSILQYYFSDTRPYAQYMHTLREMREKLVENSEGDDFLVSLLQVFPAKVRSANVDQIMNSLKQIYEQGK